MHRNRARICILPSPSQNSHSIIFNLEYYLSLLELIFFSNPQWISSDYLSSLPLSLYKLASTASHGKELCRTPIAGWSISYSFWTAPSSCKGWPPGWRQPAEVLMLQEIWWPSPSHGSGQSWSHPPSSSLFMVNESLPTHSLVQKQIKASHPPPLLLFSESSPVLLQKYQPCWFNKAWTHNLSTANKQQLFWWFSRGT